MDLLIWGAWYAEDSGSVARNDAAQLAARADTAGVGLAFAVVAGAFLISSLLLAFLRLKPAVPNSKSRAAEDKDGGSIWASIGEGFRFVRSDAAMFTLFLLIAAIELFVQGPVIVGIPVLANTQVPQGALAVGIISSAYAAGALLGAVLAGALPTPKRRLGHFLVITYVLSGILIMPFGFLTATWLAAALVAAIGVMGGYTNIIFTTWLQARTPQKVMGRVMSLLMIASTGLSPISNAVSGAMMALLSLAAGTRREIAEMKMA
ncbi:MAG: MFS transporter [Caldilineaceae bacterium]|nr:MFS transporter [Caldilineaceae bacterium]